MEELQPPRRFTLSRLNTALLCCIVALNLYTALAPLLPNLAFWWQSQSGNRKQQLVNQIHATHSNLSGAAQVPVTTAQQNRVTVPSMLLDQPILEGPVRQQYSILDKGIWRWPAGSTPDKGGNTVLIGHRFTYTNPRGVFYFLNKVKLGDEIGIAWSGKQYVYKVVSINEVPPTDTAIENQTTDSRLTLFTCTPLWIPKDRLVIVAELEHQP